MTIIGPGIHGVDIPQATEEDDLFCNVVHADRRRRTREGQGIGTQLSPVRVIPTPHRALVKVSIETAKLIDPTIEVGENHRTGDGLRRMCGRRLRPGGSGPVPKPGVTKVFASVITAKENHLANVTVISHLRISARGGRRPRFYFRPGRAIEGPGIIQISAAAEPTEKQDLLTRRVISHGDIRARCRRDARCKLCPG